MRTVAQAFQVTVEKLELTDNKDADVGRQRSGLIENLKRQLSISEEFVSGSYGRRTAIHPLHDVDLFLVLNPKVHGGLKPAECLQLLQGAVHKSYPEKGTPTVQRRSVNIEFTGTGIGFDIVPAFASENNDVYHIPDRLLGTWLRSNPRVHKQKGDEANMKAGNKLKTLIKLAKHWNTQQGKILRSFHLEVMSYGVFANAPNSYPDGLYYLFKGLSDAVLSRCADPAGLNYVDEGMDQPTRTNIRNKLIEAANTALQAIRADNNGQINQAHALWRELLGSIYPETGR